jgi:hypothetical protein
MLFEIVGEITEIETLATGSAIREGVRLRKFYGKARWRKLKGNAVIGFPDSSLHRAEIHWYEAHGIGKKEFKIKRLLKD